MSAVAAQTTCPPLFLPLGVTFLLRASGGAKVDVDSIGPVGDCLPLLRGFTVDRKIFGTSNRENFTDMFFHTTESPLIGGSHTKYHQSRRYRSLGRYLSASILIGIDVPEERQRQVLTNQIIQRTVERTQVPVQRRVPIIQKFQKIAETPQVVQRECRSSRRSRRLLRHHRNSCGRCRGSSSSRRRLSTRQVLVIQRPEDRVCPTCTGHGHDRRFPTCVTTPSTDNPDDAATTEFSQSQ